MKRNHHKKAIGTFTKEVLIIEGIEEEQPVQYNGTCCTKIKEYPTAFVLIAG
jgi:hypothetical protein